MLRTVTSQDQYARLQRDGYEPQIIKNDQERIIRVLLTKSFGFWGKVGLFIAALSRTVFTFHINDKTKDQWQALNSGKITLELHKDLWETAEKTVQQAGKHITKNNGKNGANNLGTGQSSSGKRAEKSKVVPATAYTPPKPSNTLLTEAIDLRKESFASFYHAELRPKFIDGQQVDIDQNQLNAREQTVKTLENALERTLNENIHSDKPLTLLDQFKPIMQQVCCFDDSPERVRESNLLGKFDVVTTPCIMDYDFAFRWKTQEDYDKSKQFNVLNAAALNVGENMHAEDFQAYSSGNKFNENKYIEDTDRIVHNIFQAQAALDQKNNGGASQNIDSVWVPFGMGAFQRYLHKLDKTYQNTESFFNLKRKVAHTILAQLDQFPNVTMHLCLPIAKGTPNEKESILNHNAFVEELKSMPKSIQDRVVVYVNHDATEVAQNLANNKGDNKVALVNGANRNLLGNRWFKRGALAAIDENLTRRSTRLAKIFFLLNRGTDANRVKGVGELRATVATYGGTIFRKSENKSFTPIPKQPAGQNTID